MMKSTHITRLVLRHTGAPRLAAARVVPASQPMEGDTTWFTRNPYAGSVKATPSVGEEFATAHAYDAVTNDLERQERQQIINESVEKHNAAAAAASEKSANNQGGFGKIDLTADYLAAAKADHDEILSKARVHTQEGEALDVNTAEKVRQHVAQMDLSHMPNIPGLSKEELAVKLLEFEKIKAQQAAQKLSGEAERNKRLNEIEMMRMTLSPKDFKAFMATMEKAAEASEAELEKMRSMSPQELYAYQMKKQKKEVRKQNLNLILFFSYAFGGTIMLYYFMYGYFAI